MPSRLSAVGSRRLLGETRIGAHGRAGILPIPSASNLGIGGMPRS